MLEMFYYDCDDGYMTMYFYQHRLWTGDFIVSKLFSKPEEKLWDAAKAVLRENL